MQRCWLRSFRFMIAGDAVEHKDDSHLTLFSVVAVQQALLNGQSDVASAQGWLQK